MNIAIGGYYFGVWLSREWRWGWTRLENQLLVRLGFLSFEMFRTDDRHGSSDFWDNDEDAKYDDL